MLIRKKKINGKQEDTIDLQRFSPTYMRRDACGQFIEMENTNIKKPYVHKTNMGFMASEDTMKPACNKTPK